MAINIKFNSAGVENTLREMGQELSTIQPNRNIIAMLHASMENVTNELERTTPISTGDLVGRIFQHTVEADGNAVASGFAAYREDLPKLLAAEYGTQHRRGDATLRRAWANEGESRVTRMFADRISEFMGRFALQRSVRLAQNQLQDRQEDDV